jgi:hypothetical protein
MSVFWAYWQSVKAIGTKGIWKKINIFWNHNRENETSAYISRQPSAWVLRAGFLYAWAAHFQQFSITKRRQITHQRKLIYPHSIKLQSNYFSPPKRVKLVPFENGSQLPKKSRTSENICWKQKCFAESLLNPWIYLQFQLSLVLSSASLYLCSLK